MYNLYKICSVQFGGHRGYGLRLRLNFFCFALAKNLYWYYERCKTSFIVFTCKKRDKINAMSLRFDRA